MGEEAADPAQQMHLHQKAQSKDETTQFKEDQLLVVNKNIKDQDKIPTVTHQNNSDNNNNNTDEEQHQEKEADEGEQEDGKDESSSIPLTDDDATGFSFLNTVNPSTIINGSQNTNQIQSISASSSSFPTSPPPASTPVLNPSSTSSFLLSTAQGNPQDTDSRISVLKIHLTNAKPVQEVDFSNKTKEDSKSGSDLADIKPADLPTTTTTSTSPTLTTSNNNNNNNNPNNNNNNNNNKDSNLIKSKIMASSYDGTRSQANPIIKNEARLKEESKGLSVPSSPQRSSNLTTSSSTSAINTSAGSNTNVAASGMNPTSSTTTNNNPSILDSMLHILKKPINNATRLPTLPPKSEEEELKHRREYQEMLSSYQKKADKEKQEKERIRLKREERKIKSRQFWTNDILADWVNLKGSRQIREQCFAGVPPSIRGKVWQVAVGNELNITADLYLILLSHAAKALEGKIIGKEDTVQLIPLDLTRTFPVLGFFQKDAPEYEALRKVLEAYVCFRPDVGYVQGMSYIAAMFLLYMDDFEAFCCMANLLNRPMFLNFYRMELLQINRVGKIMDILLKEFLPKLHEQFVALSVRLDIFLIDWVLTFYTKALPLDIASRIWDNFFIEGEIFFFRVALAILSATESILEGQSFDGCMKTLGHLAKADLDEEKLFDQIERYSILLTPTRYQEVCKLSQKP